MDARDASLLLDVLRRTSRSLLQYVNEAFPWITHEEQAARAQLQAMITEEMQAALALGRFLVRRRIIPPPLAPYPMDFTSINYVSLDHLLPMLAANQRQGVGRLERDLAVLTDADARAQVEALLAMERRHLKALEAMASAHSEKTAAPAAT